LFGEIGLWEKMGSFLGISVFCSYISGNKFKIKGGVEMTTRQNVNKIVLSGIMATVLMVSMCKGESTSIVNDAKDYNERGAVCYALGKTDLAISDFNKAIEINPNFIEAYSNRGTVYGKLGKTDLAIFDFNKAIKINPNYANAYSNRGIVYAMLGDIQKAKQDAIKASQLGDSGLMNLMKQKGDW